MSVDERRRRLQRRLEEVLGHEEAETLRDDISGRGVSRDELRQELQGLESRIETRFDAKLSVLSSDLRREMYEMKGDLLQQMNEQTKTLYRTIVVSNATLVFAVGGLAFAAARLA